MESGIGIFHPLAKEFNGEITDSNLNFFEGNYSPVVLLEVQRSWRSPERGSLFFQTFSQLICHGYIYISMHE